MIVSSGIAANGAIPTHNFPVGRIARLAIIPDRKEGRFCGSQYNLLRVISG